jgi:3-deoxy-manno-octulosonate cytidylyltransferase (CMP-KDO synthetase)
MKTAVLIPARYASTRFPGKPLSLIKGKPLIWHVCQRAKQSEADLIAVATDDGRIYDAVKGFGFNVFMTPDTCKSGTDRIAFIAQNNLKDYDIFINIQGDEPLIDPQLINKLSLELKNKADLNFITAAYPINNEADILSPDIVKVIFDKNGYALYFSRSPIPYNRTKEAIICYKHIGVYGYKRNFLMEFANIEPYFL